MLKFSKQQKVNREANMKILFAVILLMIAPAVASAGGVYRVINNDGVGVGVLRIKDASQGILLKLQVRGLSAGAHGLHLHAVGDCSDHQSFKRSGGHIGKAGAQHGFSHSAGHHLGDLPNLIASRAGRAWVELHVAGLSLEMLRDGDGSALIIHAEADDYKSQPIGGAGARIACAEIK